MDSQLLSRSYYALPDRTNPHESSLEENIFSSSIRNDPIFHLIRGILHRYNSRRGVQTAPRNESMEMARSTRGVN